MTPHRTPAPALRHTLLAAASTAAAAGLLLAGAPAASAHDALRSTEPSAGATPASAPRSVRLIFVEPPLSLGAQVVVTGPSGVVSSGAPRLAGDDVVQDLGPDLPAGRYTVDWRITSDDGHPVNGSFTYTAAAAASGAASSSAAVAVPSPAAPPRTVPAPTGTSTGSSLPWVGGAAALVVVVGAAAALVLRRRGSRAA